MTKLPQKSYETNGSLFCWLRSQENAYLVVNMIKNMLVRMSSEIDMYLFVLPISALDILKMTMDHPSMSSVRNCFNMFMAVYVFCN